MEIHPNKFGVQGPHEVFEPCPKLTLVLPFVRDGNAVHVCAQVVHEEAPFASEVPMAEGHFGADRASIRSQKLHAFLVPLEADGELSPLIIHVRSVSDAGRAARAGCHLIGVWQEQLIPESVSVSAIGRGAEIGNEVEAQSHVVRADHVIAQLTGEAIAPISIGGAPFGEAPIGHNVRVVRSAHSLLAAQAVKAPKSFHVRNQLNKGHGLLERILPGITLQHRHDEIVLEHLRHQLENVVRVRVGVEKDFVSARIQIPLISERGHGSVGKLMILAPEQRPLPKEHAGDGARCRSQNFVNDLRQMLFGGSNVHHLIVTEERRFVGRFLREIRETISAPADLMGGRVARIAAATRGRNPAPGLGSIRPHSSETILGDLRRRAHRTCAGGDVPKPRIGHANVSHDKLIENGSFVNEKLREIARLNIPLCWARHKMLVKLSYGLRSNCGQPNC